MRRTPVVVFAMAVLWAVSAGPARASPVLVMDRDGHVHVRDDRLLPPDPGPVADGAPATAPRSEASGARAIAAKGPSVRAELARLQAAGTLTPATATGYRDVYDLARRTLRKLSGTRRAELEAVLSNVDAAAAGGLFAPTRLPALFLTLQRNRAWWAAGPLPHAGQRMTFAASRIVWQYYPGQGLEIQWLGTFGKANGLWEGGIYDAPLRELLDEALRLATSRAGGIAFEYLFRFDGGRPPWVSGLAQGTALSALSRAAVRLGEPRYFEAARSALGIFHTPPPVGIRVETAAGAHYLQYSYAPKLHIVNGFTQALNGLHDFAVLANDPDGRALFGAGEAELRVELPSFDTGAWSLYSRPGAESDLGYHKLLRDFLRGLCDRLTSDQTRTGGTTTEDPGLYCQTAERFTADLRTPPKLTIEAPTLRARSAGAMPYTLSKASTVSITIVRQGKVILARSARLGYGRHRLGFRPPQAGRYLVRVRAVDLAGNVAATTGELSVHPGKGSAH